MSMLAEQTNFESAVRKRFGLRRRPVHYEAVQDLAKRLQWTFEKVEAEIYSPIDRLGQQWNVNHGQILRKRLESLDLTLESSQETLGADKDTLLQMMRGWIRPQGLVLAGVLDALGQSVENYTFSPVRNHYSAADGPAAEASPLATLIHHEQVKRGWSLVEMSRRTDIHPQILRNILKGSVRQPQYSKLRQLADTFELNYEEVAQATFGEPTDGGTFGARLRRFRQSALISAQEVADSVGITQKLYSLYEAGSFPRDNPERIVKIAEVLGVSADDLLGTGRGFGKWLVKSLRDQGVTLDDLALAIGRDEEVVHAWSTGSAWPDMGDVPLLARFLGTSTSEVRDYILA